MVYLRKEKDIIPNTIRLENRGNYLTFWRDGAFVVGDN